MNITWYSILKLGFVSAVISGIFSVIVILITNKHAEKQLKLQFDYERQKLLDENKESLILQEKVYIDKEIIQNLSEAIDYLPESFNELIRPMNIIQNYYIKSDSHNEGDYSISYPELVQDFNSSLELNSGKSLVKSKKLMAYAPEKLRKEYNLLIKKISLFIFDECCKQLAEITQDELFLRKYNPKRKPVMTKDEFQDACIDFMGKHGEIINKLNAELIKRVDEFRKLDL